MASKQAILLGFKVLRSIPSRTPDGFDTAAVMDQWHATTEQAGVDDAAFLAAVDRFRFTSEAKWWPAIGQLLELVPERRGNALDEADVAWAALLALFAQHGRSDPPRMSDYKPPPPRKIWDRFKKVVREVAFTDASEPWFLDSDPERRIAMELGLQAAGGWSALDDPEHAAANRAAFRQAFNAIRTRSISVAEFRQALTTRLPANRQLEAKGDLDEGYAKRFLTELGERAMRGDQ
jgi:hypothetical protein